MSRSRGFEIREGLRSHKKLKENKNENETSDSSEREQICELLYKLPKLDKIFEVHRKIGEGTFSSVYLGSLRQHSSLLDKDKRWFAIKHLVPTAHPARIEHELRCLQDIGGKHHVIGVELCLRNLDTIVFVMPYLPHKKFSEYVGDMDAAELREYMRALLEALRHVHSFGVIHRDVKPSNFLYDRENRRYQLVDFGLAQRLVPGTDEEPPAPPRSSAPRKRPREAEGATPEAKRLALDLSLKTNASKISIVETNPMPLSPRSNVKRAAPCACAGRGAVCGACSVRPPARAPRAGTQGFRPPEVLLRYGAQTTAVDTWACGVVLCSVLTARYPLLRAADDLAALAELAALLGTRPLQRAAAALGRRLITSSPRRGLCLRKLCARLRGCPPPAPAAPTPGPRARAPRPLLPAASCLHCRCLTHECICRDEDKDAAAVSPGRSVAGFPDSAFSLCWRLLQPLPAHRLSAEQALQHEFFNS